MATILSLNKSISDMTDDELYDHLRGIRASRRVMKANSKNRNKKTPSTKAPLDPMSLIRSMSPADARALLDMLGE